MTVTLSSLLKAERLLAESRVVEFPLKTAIGFEKVATDWLKVPK